MLISSTTRESCVFRLTEPENLLLADILREITEFRSALIKNGFFPVPLAGVDAVHLDNPATLKTSAGKAPMAVGWQQAAMARQSGWAEPKTTNTGVLCYQTVGVDVDVDDYARVEAIREAAGRHLGVPATERRRTGSPRVLWPYRAAVGTPTKQRIRNDRTGDMVEVLGSGNQFCVGFLHCKLIGREDGPGHDRVYSDIEWTVGLDQIQFVELPTVTGDQVAAFLAAVRLILDIRDVPSTQVYVPLPAETRFTEDQHLSNDELDDLVDHLPPANGSYDEWSGFISAIRSATAGSAFGLHLAHLYSRNSLKYDSAGVERKWVEVGKSPTVHRIGFLINQAHSHSDWLSAGAKAAIGQRKLDADLRERLRMLRAKTANANRSTRPGKMDLEF